MKIREHRSKKWQAYHEGVYSSISIAWMDEGKLDNLHYIGSYTTYAKAYKALDRYYAQLEERRHVQAEKFAREHRVHYIEMSGDRGCTPDQFASCDSYDEAVDTLATIFNLTPVKIARLRKDWYLELNPRRDGASYCEITDCDCDDPDSHNDC